MIHDCLICERIAQIKDNANPYSVAEMETGYVVIGDFQFFKGYTLFLCKKHATELHELPRDFKSTFLMEMSIVAEAVCKCFVPVKLNYELLGNTDSHLHWHLFPRHADDPNLRGSLWEIDTNLRHADDARPSTEKLEKLKYDLRKELNIIAGDRILR